MMMRSASTKVTVPPRRALTTMPELSPATCSMPVATTGGSDRDQRHGLPLHVRAHEGAVGVVVLEERNQRRRHADDLLRRDVDVLDLGGVDLGQVAVDAGEHLTLADPPLIVEHVARREDRLHLLVGPEVLDLAGDLAVLDLAVGRQQEAVLVDLRVDAQRADEADVRAFGRLDRADAAVVADVHVAHLEAGPLAVQAARAERRETALVDEHRERVGLVDDLRQLAATEEEVDGAARCSWS